MDIQLLTQKDNYMNIILGIQVYNVANTFQM